jgi:lysophospholipase L1-like esterase
VGDWFEARPRLAVLRIPRNIEYTFDASALYPGGAGKVYRRDRYGLRGAYDDPSRIDILAIGGSTTNEYHVGEGETWTDALAGRFRAAGRPVSVVNAGVDGQSTLGHLRNFDLWFPEIPGLRPRYVLAYVGINDAHVGGERARDQPEISSRRERLLRHIRERSALYELYRIVAGMLRARSAHLTYGRVQWRIAEWTEHPLPASVAEPNGVHAQVLDGYGKRLALLIGRIRKLGAEAIIVTQQLAGYRRVGGRLLMGTGHPFIELWRYELQLAINARAMQVCRANGAICIDLGNELEFEPDDFYDHLHTTPSGSRRIGNFLYARLKDIIR